MQEKQQVHIATTFLSVCSYYKFYNVVCQEAEDGPQGSAELNPEDGCVVES